MVHIHVYALFVAYVIAAHYAMQEGTCRQSHTLLLHQRGFRPLYPRHRIRVTAVMSIQQSCKQGIYVTARYELSDTLSSLRSQCILVQMSTTQIQAIDLLIVMP